MSGTAAFIECYLRNNISDRLLANYAMSMAHIITAQCVLTDDAQEIVIINCLLTNMCGQTFSRLV